MFCNFIETNKNYAIFTNKLLKQFESDNKMIENILLTKQKKLLHRCNFEYCDIKLPSYLKIDNYYFVSLLTSWL